MARDSSTMKAVQSVDGYSSRQIVASKYRLLEVAGKGAFGTVWVAENVAIDSRVALKLFRRDDNGATAEKLSREARATTKLKHAGIVRVFDIGETERGDPFLVMDFLDGENLAQYLRRVKRCTEIDAARIVLPVADALVAAHSLGIIHRDLKPANLILAPAEAGRIQPVVVDFGLAQHREVNGEVTVEGALLGSPHYMSPEQVTGASVEARSDVWALCVILYEMVAGSYPFNGATEYSLLRSIVESPPTALRSSVNSAFRTIVESGLRKKVGDRPTMTELGRALAQWLFNRGVKDDITARSLRNTWLASPAVSAALPPAPLPKVAAKKVVPPPSRPEADGYASSSELVDDEPSSDASPRMEQPTVRPPVTVLLRPSDAPTRATVPGAHEPDLARLREVLGEPGARRAPSFDVAPAKPAASRPKPPPASVAKKPPTPAVLRTVNVAAPVAAAPPAVAPGPASVPASPPAFRAPVDEAPARLLDAPPSESSSIAVDVGSSTSSQVLPDSPRALPNRVVLGVACAGLIMAVLGGVVWVRKQSAGPATASALSTVSAPSASEASSASVAQASSVSGTAQPGSAGDDAPTLGASTAKPVGRPEGVTDSPGTRSPPTAASTATPPATPATAATAATAATGATAATATIKKTRPTKGKDEDLGF